jgi:cell division protein FtsI (penicillin-binding protein 3)
MNPHTGEILAMANEPTFNPNAYRDSGELERRNRAIQDLYEPGSTFKVVTASAAIEERVLSVDTLIDTNPGRLRIGSRVITDDAGRNNGVLSFANVIVKSSNIGAVKIGFKVGTERMSRFVGAYGFGRQVSPDFPAENPGIVWRPEKWTDTALASVSMGYQVAVTPLQMVAAVSSVANGGIYVEPRVIRAVYRDGRRYQLTPKTLRRTVSADTAATLTTIMESVVSSGTAKRAQIPGYTIAGKTGTAQKLIDGRYSHSDHYASFVGFLPSRAPELAIVVVIDSAKGPNGDHGGMVAAPIFRTIAEAALHYLGIAPTLNPAPPVLVARHDGAAPAAAAATAPQPIVSLVADDRPNTVPDLRGLSAREAVRKLVTLGMTARVSGNGVVVSQDPPAGAPIDRDAVCRLTLERWPSRRPATTSHQ